MRDMTLDGSIEARVALQKGKASRTTVEGSVCAMLHSTSSIILSRNKRKVAQIESTKRQWRREVMEKVKV